MNITMDCRSGNTGDLMRGVVSHLLAQVKSIGRLLSTPFVPGRQSRLAIFVNVFDDATMWIQKPRTADQLLDRSEELRARRRGAGVPPTAEEKIRMKIKRRSKNMHMPVMNISEHVVLPSRTSSNQAIW